MPRFARPLAGLLLAALLGGPTTAGAALAPPVVVDAGCAGQATADAAARAGGGIRGFASFAGRGCGDAIWFFEGGPGGWRASLTPYRGTVIAVADDGRDTFLLYRSGGSVRVTRRTPLAFTPGRRLGAGAGGGDIVARGGRWWAVWSASLPGGRARLRQAGNIGGLTDRAPLTAGGGGRTDSTPSIALHADGRRLLAWERNWPDGRGTIQVATARAAAGRFGPWPGSSRSACPRPAPISRSRAGAPTWSGRTATSPAWPTTAAAGACASVRPGTAPARRPGSPRAAGPCTRPGPSGSPWPSAPRSTRAASCAAARRPRLTSRRPRSSWPATATVTWPSRPTTAPTIACSPWSPPAPAPPPWSARVAASSP
jgi:hypothetical protein